MTLATSQLSVTDAERRRVEHIDRLVAMGGLAGGDLVAGLDDPSWTVRRAVTSALAALGDDVVPRLCEWLAHERTSERAIAAAVDALSASIGTAANAAVLALLATPDPAVAADAAVILGRRRAAEAVPALVLHLLDASDNVAVAAIEALGAIGGTVAVDALVEVVAAASFFRAFPAMQVLARTGDPRAVAPLAARLADELYRDEAALALGLTGSPLAVAPLAGLVVGGELAVARRVALALAELFARASWLGGGRHIADLVRSELAPVHDLFVRALRDADATERAAIVTVLGMLGREAATLDALASGDVGVRLAILSGVSSARAAGAVRALLGDDDSEVRARACEALARIGDTAAVPRLFELLADASPRVTHAATAAIQSLGMKRTGPLVAAALRDRRSPVRRHALRVVAYLACPEAMAAVEASLADPDPRTAALAVAALAAYTGDRVDARLVVLARDPREDVRAAAVRVLGQRGQPGVIAFLESALADDSAWVRYYACQGLGRQPEAHAGMLVDRLSDAAPQVRIAAIEALAQLGTPAAWQALTSLARSSDPDSRRAALVGLGLRDEPAALPFLLEAVRSTDVATRLIALSGLARSTDPRALAELVRAAGIAGDDDARDTTAEVRDAALALLAERNDAGAAEALVESALARPTDSRAHDALARPGEARRMALAARLARADDRDAPVLAAALGRMGDDDATTALFAALSGQNPAARRAAAVTVAATGSARARVALARLAAEDPDPEVRRACAAAVER